MCHLPILNEQGTGITVKELTVGLHSNCIIPNEDDQIRCFGTSMNGALGLGYENHNVGGIQHYPETIFTFLESNGIEYYSQCRCRWTKRDG